MFLKEDDRLNQKLQNLTYSHFFKKKLPISYGWKSRHTFYGKNPAHLGENNNPIPLTIMAKNWIFGM